MFTGSFLSSQANARTGVRRDHGRVSIRLRRLHRRGNPRYRRAGAPFESRWWVPFSCRNRRRRPHRCRSRRQPGAPSHRLCPAPRLVCGLLFQVLLFSLPTSMRSSRTRAGATRCRSWSRLWSLTRQVGLSDHSAVNSRARSRVHLRCIDRRVNSSDDRYWRSYVVECGHLE